MAILRFPVRYTSTVRRLIRIVSKVVAVASLLFCLAALGLWMRSYFAYQYVIRKEPRDTQWVEVSRGELSVLLLRGANMGDLPLGSPAEWGWGSHSPTDLLPITRTLAPGESRPLLGFYVRRGPYNFGSSTKVIVPMPAVVVVLALPAAVWGVVLVRRRRARRLAAGRCLGCGYDLRATPQRCPECGRVVGKS
jgi:hypothetical protein